MTLPTLQSLQSLLATPLTQALPRSPLSQILSSPPFIPIPSIPNLRDLSSHPSAPTAIPRNRIFRSGTLELLTPEGITALQNLGIKTIFDLRSRSERDGFPTPEIEGVRVVWTASTLDDPTTAATTAASTSAEQAEKQDKPFDYVDMYTALLSTHAPVYKLILTHISTHPSEKILFHCTAGKDRTGVLAFILEEIAGSALNAMEMEYALTRVGVEEYRGFLTGKLLGSAGAGMGREEVEAFLNSETMKAYRDVQEGLMGKVREEIGRKWDRGVVGYVREELGLGHEEIERVRRALRGEV